MKVKIEICPWPSLVRFRSDLIMKRPQNVLLIPLLLIQRGEICESTNRCYITAEILGLNLEVKAETCQKKGIPPPVVSRVHGGGSFMPG